MIKTIITTIIIIIITTIITTTTIIITATIITTTTITIITTYIITQALSILMYITINNELHFYYTQIKQMNVIVGFVIFKLKLIKLKRTLQHYKNKVRLKYCQNMKLL